ncbi:hypothetical protein P43SY_005073 [Pythium insidiosum]|uniref:ZSWIM1/3 RNaseH-like domain-containing protein n=1 Tax=Pythium insidiosum TaxID=114742 RepID=A0AAD5L9W1_PYTIN|nr:hypothetical protein P43SY_005073 [Pythium insidiosum]
MPRVLEHFEHVNPGVAEKVEVLMVDKDLNEIKILRKYFPCAGVLICSFHVVKYLKAASRKPEYGKVSADDHDAIDAIAHNMVYARTKEEYESNRDMLRDVCATVGYGAFYAYFEANWDSHLKGNIQRSFTMTETVDALIKDDRARAHEYLHKKTKIGRFYNANYDADMNQLLLFTNPFMAESVEEEYKLAFAMRDVFIRPPPPTMNVRKLAILLTLLCGVALSSAADNSTALPTTKPTAADVPTKEELLAILTEVREKAKTDPELAKLLKEIDIDALLTKDPAEVQKILNEKLFKGEAAPASSKAGSGAQETVIAPSGSKAGSKSNAAKDNSAEVATTKAPVPAPSATQKSSALKLAVAPAAVAFSSAVIYTML